ncbi:hypothetical protein CRENBAI_008308 [Crenichthys baileyi]|uniref:Uncharacterized protein n=1 Tax=Crenichthys baileyi TaxID=28760 RepID=A0AAV9SQH6_9TELE
MFIYAQDPRPVVQEAVNKTYRIYRNRTGTRLTWILEQSRSITGNSRYLAEQGNGEQMKPLSLYTGKVNGETMGTRGVVNQMNAYRCAGQVKGTEVKGGCSGN